MALSRRTGQRFQGSIWPGFVDAMTALLLVLMFVLTIFMVVQSVLRETITGQETQLDELSSQVMSLADALGLEKENSAALRDEVGRLTAGLQDAADEADVQARLIASLTAQTEQQADELAQQRAAITSFESQVATLLSQRDDAIARGDDLATTLTEAEAANARLIGEKEALQLALASAREEIDASVEEARLAAAKREALEALIADLQQESESQETSLAALAAQLDEAQQQYQALEAETSDSQEKIEALEAERLAEQAAAEALRARLADTEGALTELEKEKLAEAAAAEALRQKLAEADTELTAMTLALEAKRKEAEDTLTLLAAAELAQADRADEAENAMSEVEKQRALLAVANDRLAEEEAKSAESLRQVALLNEQVSELRIQLGSLQAMLDEADAKDAAAEVQIQALGSRLNTALARVASEEKKRRALEEAERRRLELEAQALRDQTQDLARYRSEFFGRLRDLLGTQEGVRIEGDRFVFSSEVLFALGAVELSEEGKGEVAKVAAILKSVADQIPPEIDWVIRVDGHTDNIPLVSTGKYRDNWELSQGRALSVVRYMVDALGIPPDRLAANGFGEYQPVNPADTPEARAQNRRIELKFTEK
ncbi:peptidoglycan -binding protein [Halocynthiibacter sp. C4]|uniref:peptidoglycan -binding protein n=1 Tax=Halocynthiibacter sp. C4 TaxID=2992758 RepID=UPI00237C4E87|nr:peptidoglycan -binding protein [Halocynthiibacter sp. C4]MDE0590302.1 peptidoglycan -binding protein [Halocynthiibacter sp. C4]